MGHIYAPDGRVPWARQYAFPPTPYRLDDELLRIYVAFCDEHTVGRVGYVDVRLDDPAQVVHVSQRPVLDIGEPGCFDDNGVLPISVLPVGDALYMYYTGYQLGTKVSYFQFTGLAISRDGGDTFERWSRAPVVDRSDTETLTRASAFVSRQGGGFRMHYSAGAEWTMNRAGKPVPIYRLRWMDSDDPTSWPSEGNLCIDFAAEDEHAIGRPWLIGGTDPHRLLYSYRTTSRDYRLGLALSADGISWDRRDEEVGIDVSADGWDSEAIAYGSVVEHEGAIYLFYCGNERGKTGFGYAELESW